MPASQGDAAPLANRDAADPPAPDAERRASSVPPAPLGGELGVEQLPQVLTADELSALLRINRKTVYAAFSAGEIPGGRRIGGTIRFSRDAVLRWLAEGGVARPSGASR